MVEKIVLSPTPVHINVSGGLNVGEQLNHALFGGVIDWFHHSFIYTMPRYYWYGIAGILLLFIVWWFIKNFIL
jgi:hypothetical protein